MDYGQLSLEELLRYTQDHESWYWIGMAYWECGDFINAAKWLEKTMDDYDNKWAGKATLNLGLFHVGRFIPNTSRDEALRLFEKNPNGAISKLNAGFLYYNGTETKHDPAKGKGLIEAAVSQLIKDKGDDSYLAPDDCYSIGLICHKEKLHTKAIEYYKKAINRTQNDTCDRRLVDEVRNKLRELGVVVTT